MLIFKFLRFNLIINSGGGGVRASPVVMYSALYLHMWKAKMKK